MCWSKSRRFLSKYEKTKSKAQRFWPKTKARSLLPPSPLRPPRFGVICVIFLVYGKFLISNSYVKISIISVQIWNILVEISDISVKIYNILVKISTIFVKISILSVKISNILIEIASISVEISNISNEISKIFVGISNTSVAILKVSDNISNILVEKSWTFRSKVRIFR